MTACLVGQRYIELTSPFGTSAGMGLSAADLEGICTQARIASGKQSAPWGMLCSRLHAHRARPCRMIVVTGNFESP